MTNKEFEKILLQGENSTIEFKKGIDKEIKNEICAFLNALGGKLIIGVDDKNVVCGVKIDNKIRSQLQSSISAIQPNPDLSIIEYHFKGKKILIIDCLADDKKPYMCSGSIYVRKGANTQKLLTPNEIRAFFQAENKIFFEKMSNTKFSYLNDFDNKKFDNFLDQTTISKQLSQKQILGNLDLFSKKGELINAGILFFAKTVQKFHKHASIRCLLFKGTTKSLILDDKLITGNLTEQYQGALVFLKSKLELRYEIKTANPRIEKYEIPEVVFKEAIINALVHRDYYELGGKIHIEIYDNRLEITNPGGLIATIKENEFGKRSVSRNPMIFHFFQRLNLVEQVGSGISRMQDAMQIENLPAPHFSLEGMFTVTLFRFVNFNNWLESWKNRLSKTQISLLTLINKNNTITQSEMANLTEFGKTTIYTNITKLKKLKVLKRIGSDKKGYWAIYYKK